MYIIKRDDACCKLIKFIYFLFFSLIVNRKRLLFYYAYCCVVFDGGFIYSAVNWYKVCQAMSHLCFLHISIC